MRLGRFSPTQPWVDRHVGAWGGAGQVAMRLGDLETAEQRLREALRLAPEYGPARYALGQVLRRQGHLDDAARHGVEPRRERRIAAWRWLLARVPWRTSE
ncbi:MAG: tetratricopeptide repeat protein [Planctomycetes bacterium]|nr:tetratricopeptide repeat protein [Planctomycetota bacterium]